MGKLIDGEYRFRMQGAHHNTARFSDHYNRPLGKDLHQNALVPGISNIDLLKATPKLVFYTIRHGIQAPELPQVPQEGRIIDIQNHRRTPPPPAS